MPPATAQDSQEFKGAAGSLSLNILVRFVGADISHGIFITRRAIVGSGRERVDTTQCTLIRSESDLDEWIANDDHLEEFPALFEQVKAFYLTGRP
jgi:hypothetical protein